MQLPSIVLGVECPAVPLISVPTQNPYRNLVGYLFRVSYWTYISPPLSRRTPGVFYTCFCFYNHAHRIRLEKLLYLEPSRSSDGFF
jgi:hypothetical protein